MLEGLNRAKSSRMRPDLESTIEYLPGLAGLALWCCFADTDDPEAIAYTDGNTIYAGAGYEEFEPKEQRFICLHEILHIALCHPQRFAELEKRDPANSNSKLLNIAADAVINTSLENLTALETPKNAWTLSRLWECLEKSENATNPQRLRQIKTFLITHLTQRRGSREKLPILRERISPELFAGRARNFIIF